jgi:ribosomal protein S21
MYDDIEANSIEEAIKKFKEENRHATITEVKKQS